MSVLIETTIGDLVVDLFIKERPKCCFNFLNLCKMKYYNYSLFHNVQHNFIAQTGIPVDDVENGGYSIFKQLGNKKYFDRELKPRIKHTVKGMVSFVNNLNEQHGSQFFFTLSDSLTHLDSKHTVFGIVTEGMEIIDKLNDTFCDKNCIPFQDIRISHTIVLFDPFEKPENLHYPHSPPPEPELLRSNRIGAEEDLDEFKGMTNEQIKKVIEDRELKSGTKILEMVGDIPDADMKPPENVLFICKLNPDTIEKDLKIIFSRFGKVLSCDVIRDHKSGDSLQYGFIEFDKVEDCERAYFKMDNVLIDDRRIHVDFCQSIHRSKWNKTKLRKKYKFVGNEAREENIEKKYDPNTKRRSSSRENTPRRRRLSPKSYSPKSYKGRVSSGESRDRHKKQEDSRNPRRHDTPSVRSFR